MSRKNGKLNKLRHQHRVAVALKLRGLKHADIADEVGATKGTVDTWFSDPLVKQELADQSENLLVELRESAASGAVVAVEVAKKMAQAPGLDGPIDPETRLAVIRELRTLAAETHPDRHKPVEGGDQNMNIAQAIFNMPPEQLQEFLDKSEQRVLESGS